jgi:osmotically-inducible protein OsmY
LIVGGAAATGTSIALDDRTTGTVVEDQAIELRIRSALSRIPGMTKQTHINVISYNGIVLLVGEAPSESLRTLAGDTAQGQSKVRRVHNEIKIAAPSALMVRSSDTVITGKVKTALLNIGIRGADALRVKVVTENGTVYLMGLVTREEGDKITNAARRVSGVQRIVKLFEHPA